MSNQTNATSWCEITSNGTVLEICDAKIDISWWLVPKIAGSAVLLAEGLASWKLCDIIIDYLNSKPLNRQGLVDLLRRTMLNSMKLFTASGWMQILLDRVFLDDGEVIAKGWMWISYDFAMAGVATVGLTPLLQQ